MRKWMGLTLAFGLLACLSAAPAGALDSSFSGSIAGTEPTQTGRLHRSEPASTCATGQSASLIDATTQFRYDAFTYKQGAAASCVTVALQRNACTGAANHIHAAAYLGRFNPANPLQNYLADIGGGPNPGPKGFSFNLPANQTVVIVVAEALAGSTCSYQGTVSGLSTPTPPRGRPSRPATINPRYPRPSFSSAGFTTFTSFVISRLPAGAQVVLRYRGGTERRRANPAGCASSRMLRRRFPGGAVISVRITKAGFRPYSGTVRILIRPPWISVKRG